VDGAPTGIRKRRGDVHRDGDWHGALHIWVGGVDEKGRPFALFQRRSRTKDTWPGSLDVAVGGHFRAGETLSEALREAEEEIGLSVVTADITRLGRRFASSGSGRDNEVQEVFGLRSDIPLDAYRLHPDEVDAVVSVSLDAILALFEGREMVVPGVELRRDSVRPAIAHLTVSGFAAGADDGYPARALQGLLDVIGGRAPEPFELR
jgi:isopentenyldiphosphate isomerase